MSIAAMDAHYIAGRGGALFPHQNCGETPPHRVTAPLTNI